MPWIAGLVSIVVVAVMAPVASAHHVEMPGEVQNFQSAMPALVEGGGTWTPEDAADDDKKNMTLLANLGLLDWSPGSDIAFQENLAIAGNYGGGPSKHPGGFRVIDIADPSNPEMIGDFKCPGPQADVSVWEDLVFVSVDSARAAESCTVKNADGSESFTPAATTANFAAGKAFEGIRIVSIADPTNPRQIGFVDTDCGSHTHTLVPDVGNGRLLIYVLSYPIGVQAVDCSVVSHRKFSIVEVPLDDPANAKVIATPTTGASIGCHDVTVFLPRMLAGAACLTDSQVWDISDPAQPKTVATIPHPPGMQISHSSQFSWDGDTLVLGDEKGGAVAAAGCTDAHHAPLGALWFYDVSDPKKPVVKGSFRIPQTRYSSPCTAHNFNAIPFADSERDVLTASWYHGGTTLVDFTDPSKPQQLGWYIANGTAPDDLRSTPWSSYFYNGHVFANNFENGYPVDATARGFDSMRIDAEAGLPGTVTLDRLNPQTQVAWPAASAGVAETAAERAAETPAAGEPAVSGSSAAPAPRSKGRRTSVRFGKRFAFRRAAMRRGFGAQVTCSTACEVTARLKYGLMRVGSARRSGDGSFPLRVRLDRKRVGRLSDVRASRLRMVVIVRDGEERPFKRVGGFIVRRPAQR